MIIWIFTAKKSRPPTYPKYNYWLTVSSSFQLQKSPLHSLNKKQELFLFKKWHIDKAKNIYSSGLSTCILNVKTHHPNLTWIRKSKNIFLMPSPFISCLPRHSPSPMGEGWRLEQLTLQEPIVLVLWHILETSCDPIILAMTDKSRSWTSCMPCIRTSAPSACVLNKFYF